ncbi:hypothetical protein [Paracraurococcus lichenis]|uniref:hypothetical protein n=1 Tax=Paracraurococcus lichenis TaxID=3064888 RepID=UPI00351CE258
MHQPYYFAAYFEIDTISAGAAVGSAKESLGVGGIDKVHLDALILRRIGEEVSGAAKGGGGRDDSVAGTRQVLHREGRNGLAGADRRPPTRRASAGSTGGRHVSFC